MSQIAEFHATVIRCLPELTSSEMQAWIGAGSLRLRSTLECLRLTQEGISSVMVDQNATFTERVTAGYYNWVSEDVNHQNFPIRPRQYGMHLVKLFHFNQEISSEDAVTEIRLARWFPAMAAHILAYGAAAQEMEWEYPIIALGQKGGFASGYHVLVLSQDQDGHCLDANAWESDSWPPHSRFLAFRPL